MKRIFALILAVCMLAGCSLAKPGKAGQDKLTGFFVTVSCRDGDTMVDLWDEEATGMEMISNHYLAGQKLYARRIEGDPVVYEFPEGCGLSCFSYDVEEGRVPYRSNTISPEIDAHLGFYAGTEMPYRMDAVVYGTRDSDAVICMNPVYQTPDGEVYVLSDKPMSYDVATMDGCSASISQTGEDGCTATLTIRHVVLPENYIIIEMNEENQPLRQAEFAPGELPETYTPGADAAYLILEARAGEDTTRTVYSPGDENTAMDTYRPGQYGLCIKGYTRIEWEGTK
jgi:hypothetical protein